MKMIIQVMALDLFGNLNENERRISLGATTFRKMTFTITTLSMKGSHVALSINGIQHNNAPAVC
jgi:hypothetical protein